MCVCVCVYIYIAVAPVRVALASPVKQLKQTNEPLTNPYP